MRLLPKRLSLHIQTESRKLKKTKKAIKKRYHELERERDSSEGTITSDDYDEAITPEESPSSSVKVELPLGLADNSGNFVRTMRIIKRESKRISTFMINDGDTSEIESYLDDSNKTLNNDPPSLSNLEYSTEDIYSEYFFEKSAKERAIFIACRLKKQLPSIFSGIQLTITKDSPETIHEISSLDITKMIADRLFTLTYINDMMTTPAERDEILENLETNLSKQGDSKLSQKSGGREAFFAFRYTLDHYFKHSILPSQKTLMVERARKIIQECIESEEKLSVSERECMYCFHRLMSGMNWDEDMEPTLYGLND
jgi:hypothetical protein